ncbi:cytochrome-c peroxidase [Salipiger mucosus]|uniref:cytochrome-c peroxidase n=1 Tax=Salipiger mucosus TaxID=263378 RepID=UPI0012EB7B25|nr:cytochrome c peroxidase [Salipiger mucosus]
MLDILFRIAIIGVGLSMPIWLYLAELRPRVLMHRAGDDLRALAAACDQALRTADASAETRDRLDAAQASRLEHALEIGRLPCKRYAALTEQLLSEGVSRHALAALRLAATADPSYPDLRAGRADVEALDAHLRVAARLYGLAPLPVKEDVPDPKFRLGKRLFFDPALSGQGERSCATCHGLAAATAGGAALEARLDVSPEWLPNVPARNVPDLWNRDHNDVSAMLWDGRLQALTTAGQGAFVLPETLVTGRFENLMALQSVRPIFVPVEMLGEPGASNALAPDAAGTPAPEAVLARVARRLFGDDARGQSEAESYRALFRESYGVATADEVRPSHLGNALAHYIEIEFQSRDTPWDRYLAGDLSAISEDQKRGALLFYGIGKCAVCHSGAIFSDFGFHSVGVPDRRDEKDLGRVYATGMPGDRFLFRTPPLRNVTLTAPYFHNGQAGTLVEAIRQHLDPYRNARVYAEDGAHLMEPAEIDAISPILASHALITDDQIELLIDFLESLEDRGAGAMSR